MKQLNKILIICALLPSLGAAAQNRLFKTAPSELKGDDGFGWAVSFDDSNAVVTAARADGISSDQGAAWVYKVSNQALTAPQKITHSGNQAFAHFGNDVAISGSNLLVCAYGASDKGAHAGAVYYYRFNGNTWQFVQTLFASDARKNDHFGYSIDLKGDVAVIGAPGIQSNHHKGKAYVFRLQSSGTWKEEKILLPKKSSPKSAFGWDVCIGEGTIAVSDVYANTKTIQTGQVELFRFNNNTWSYETTITPADGNGNEMFGCSIDLDNNMLAVGASRAIGAGNEMPQRTTTGAVYMYQKVNDNWRPAGMLTGDGASNNHDHFGFSVALSGNKLVVGCNQDDFMAKNAGSAYVFVFKGNSWTQVNKFLPVDGNEHDFYGSSVAINGNAILVGARMGEDDTARADHGKVYFHTQVDLPLSIKDVPLADEKGSHVSVFPNPVSRDSKVVIKTRGTIEVVSVYDMSGRLAALLKNRETTGEDEYTYRLDADLETGMYIVNVKLSEGTKNVRILKD